MAKIHIELEEHDLRRASTLAPLVAMLQGLLAAIPAAEAQDRAEKLAACVREEPKRAGQTLDPADNPATGMPSPAEAFGTLGGNVGGVSGSASSPSPAPTGAALTSAPEASTTALNVPGGGAAVALPDPAAAFGGAALPNVPALPVPVPAAGSVATSTPMPPSGPSAPPSAPAAAAAGVELDSEGIPWDARIHSESKAKIAKGTWKVKRGTGETYLNEVKAQLRQAVAGAPAGNAQPPAAAVPPPPPAGAAPIPTPTPSPQTTPGVAASNGAITMAQLLPRVTAAITSGKLTADAAGAICHQLSNGAVSNVAMLAVRPDLIPHVWAQLDALGV